MELQHFIAKIYTDAGSRFEPARCVNLFHRWVSLQSMPEMLVDVAELLHVPDGPGVIAVGVEADYAYDHGGGRWGALYRRKSTLPGTNADRMAQAFRAAAASCRLLETEFPAEVKFSRTEFELVVNDRALAPNGTSTLAGCEQDVRTFAEGVLGHRDVALRPLNADPRGRFGVVVTSAKPFGL